MLQEIINRITGPGKTAFKKLQDFLYDSTLGLAREYQRKTLELARITVASYYLQAMRGLRLAAIALFFVTLASIVFAVALVIVPIILVLMCPWTAAQKMVAVSILGLIDISAAVFYLVNLFSEERWMKITKTQEIINQIKNQ